MMAYRTKDEIELIATKFMAALLVESDRKQDDGYDLHLAKRAINCAFVFFTEIDKVGRQFLREEEAEVRGTTRDERKST